MAPQFSGIELRFFTTNKSLLVLIYQWGLQVSWIIACFKHRHLPKKWRLVSVQNTGTALF